MKFKHFSNSLLRSKSCENAARFVFSLCSSFGAFVLGFILFVALKKGWDRLDFSFLISAAKSGGLEGGIVYQILGTLVLISTAALITTPFAVAISILERTSSFPSLKVWIRSALHLLNATPSILFGIVGFIFFVKFCEWDKSWLGGGVILAIMILPTVTLSLINRIETIPHGYLETAKSLGLTDDDLIKSILIPYGYGGLLTGLFMGLARAAGETAPIMFTAVVFSGATFPTGVKDNPVLALPYHIFNMAQDFLGDGAISGAWATAFVLICFVLLVSLCLAPFRSRSHEEARQK
ncbi:MAG: PstA family ABC transporter permease [Oligoflexales bacterium]